MSQFKTTILITGATNGLGLETARILAKRCPDQQIIIASRRDNGAVQDINAKNVTFIPLDLSSLEGVRKFAKEVEKYPRISIMLLNAALQFPHEVGYYSSGIERTLAITHVGHSLLFHLLAHHLTENARIIVTASGVHDPDQKTGMPKPAWTTAAEAARPDPKTAPKDGRLWYVHAKLANIMWMYALDRRIKQQQKQWTVTAFDPGLLPGSGLAREYSGFLRFLWHHVFPRIMPILRIAFGTDNVHTTQESGFALARLATDDVDRGGKYFEGLKVISSSKDSYNEAKQEDLWSWTINEVATDEAEKRAFESLS